MPGRKSFFQKFAVKSLPHKDETAEEILQARIAQIRERLTVRDWDQPVFSEFEVDDAMVVLPVNEPEEPGQDESKHQAETTPDKGEPRDSKDSDTPAIFSKK